MKVQQNNGIVITQDLKLELNINGIIEKLGAPRTLLPVERL